ncbi:uncharacterized protein ACA1_052720 [Acanthamoeba castellanii str. Neff]|uniref:Uncharacterized protein n=1 Tax=Acanthamoeba castellanii (strain ATCC 30010 / Neff) TaxID=1257118 RepID=L8H623_ACACF|nr:uncharacterized protein ACA1_052720 [Acanthamoeba castellanii str. Neff]ELR20580.1 hypothetical protein ACA1_052720 [Acanthamoeba castellanii str. Neff]
MLSAWCADAATSTTACTSFDLGTLAQMNGGATSGAPSATALRKRVLERISTALQGEEAGVRELATAVARFFEDSDVVLLGYKIGDVVSDLLEHPHSDMAAVGVELWLGSKRLQDSKGKKSAGDGGGVGGVGSNNTYAGLCKKVLGLLDRHDDWATKRLVLSQRTFLAIPSLAQFSRPLLEAYFERFLQACSASAMEPQLARLSVEFLRSLCKICEHLCDIANRVNVRVVPTPAHHSLVHTTLAIMEGSTDEELVTSAMNLFYCGWKVDRACTPTHSRFWNESNISTTLDRLYKVLVRHAQYYDGGVASLFDQCARFVVLSDRWRNQLAQLPADVQHAMLDVIAADPAHARHNGQGASWLDGGSGASTLRNRRREVAKQCLVLLGTTWTDVEETAMLNLLTSETGAFLLGAVMGDLGLDSLLRMLDDPSISSYGQTPRLLFRRAHPEKVWREPEPTVYSHPHQLWSYPLLVCTFEIHRIDLVDGQPIPQRAKRARVRYTACLACSRLYMPLKANHLLYAALGGLVRNLRDSSNRGVQHAAAQALTGLLSTQNPVADRDQLDAEVEKVVEACAHAIRDQQAMGDEPIASIVRLLAIDGIFSGWVVGSFHKEMLGTTFDQRVAEKNKARIERYLPLMLDTIATCAHALPLQIFFLFVHRAMPVLRDDLKALVVNKCYRLLRSASARPQSPGDSYCALRAALLIIVCEVGAAPLPPSITAEDLTDTLHESIEECTRDGQQLPATKTTQGPWEANMHAKHFLEHLANTSPLVLAPHVEQVLTIVHESWQQKPYLSLALLAALAVLMLQFPGRTREFMETKLLPHIIKQDTLNDCPSPLLIMAAAHAPVIAAAPGAFTARSVVMAVRMLPQLLRPSAWGGANRAHYREAAVRGGVHLLTALLDENETKAKAPSSAKVSKEQAVMMVEALVGLAKQQLSTTTDHASGQGDGEEEEAKNRGREVSALRDVARQLVAHILPPPLPSIDEDLTAEDEGWRGALRGVLSGAPAQVIDDLGLACLLDACVQV